MDEFPPLALSQNPELVQQFLRNVRGAVPLTIEQIDMMLRLISAARERVASFLDLGCGDGVLSAAIIEEHPEARGTLCDESELILESARRRLGPHADRFHFVLTDFREPGWVAKVASGLPFDAVVSAFALDGEADERKRAIYSEIFNVLAPGGVFLNSEHVSSATRWTELAVDDYLITAIFGEVLRDAAGKPRAEVAREYYARARRPGFEIAPLEVQFDWLRESGFENVECYLKVQELALFGGQRPAPGV